MSDYDRLKQSLLSAVDLLKPLVREESGRSLAEVGNKLREEVFNLVILGQFKRGKSTFINALLGEELLPTAIVPLTSVVTIIHYGPRVSVHVQFTDSREEEVPLKSLPDYITERGNPENRKGVREVIVYHPSAYLRDGVRIIDTPGVGSVYRHNTDVAYRYLPHVDAGIFIVSADPPLSESEHQFLKDIRDYVDKIFFVVNKIDQVSDQDREESMEFTRSVLRRDLQRDDVMLYPLSARWAVEARESSDSDKLQKSLLPLFEKQLQSFLMHEKGLVLLRSAVQGLLRLVSGETVALQLEQEAVKLPLKELTAKIAQFEAEMKSISRDKEQHNYLLQGRLGKITSTLDDQIKTFKQANLPLLHEALEKEYSKQLDHGCLRREELERFVFENIRDAFTPWRLQMTELIAADIEEAHQELAKKTNEVIERILELTSSIFQLPLKPFSAVEPLSQKSRFYFLFKDDPVGLELIQLAVTSSLPTFLVKKMLLKNMKAAVTDLVDRHCGRVRYDLLQRVQTTVAEFRKALGERIDQTLEGIRGALGKALAMKQSSEVDTLRNLDALHVKLQSVNDIQSQLLMWSQELAAMNSRR
jgi:GTP-binding protein EngB required for normal cell division